MKIIDKLILDKPTIYDLQRFIDINFKSEESSNPVEDEIIYTKAKIIFMSLLDHWDEKKFGSWRISEKADPNYVIGFAGIYYRLYGDEIKLNLGYAFDRKYWGNGYATETARYAIGYGFDELKVNEIFAIVSPQNFASIKVLEKCNLSLAGQIVDLANYKSDNVYQIDREMYVKYYS
jgi:[ribosomal protein S5]-alanine N-acetyltransferase